MKRIAIMFAAAILAAIITTGCTPALASTSDAPTFHRVSDVPAAESQDGPASVGSAPAEPAPGPQADIQEAVNEGQQGEPEAVYAEETQDTPEYAEQPEPEPCEPSQEPEPQPENGPGLTREGGVNAFDGRTETYYSSQVTRHYRTDEWTVDSEGFYRDSEGRYVVAAGDMPEGTVFEGSKGECVVLDSGCDDGVTDYYVNWS